MSIQAQKIRVEVGPTPKRRKKGVIYFASFEEMSKALTPNRVELLEIIKRERPESIYRLAELAGRDQGNVTKDVNELERHGFVRIVKSTEGRTRSEPKVDQEAIEMVIKLAAGAFGVAQEALEEISGEFKGKRLAENKKYVREKSDDIVEPVRKAVKKAAKRIADELDIATK